jgi:hypothetical protein
MFYKLKNYIMKWKGKKPYETVIKKRFALFPINLNGETRWLEFVKIEGYYWKGPSGTWWWEPQKFVD